jgi:hypothetical protein
MQQTTRMDAYQANMQPGHITLKGLLGTDTRNLVDILIDDNAEVQRIGLSHVAIAERMQALRELGMQGLGNTITVEEHFEVRVDCVRGKLPCPFDDAIFRKTFVQVRNLKLQRCITYTDMHIHMIKEHGFYEGKGSALRLDPHALAEILEIPEPPPDANT